MRRCSFRWCLYLKAFPHSVHLNLRFPAPSFSSCGCGGKNKKFRWAEGRVGVGEQRGKQITSWRGNLIVVCKADLTDSPRRLTHRWNTFWEQCGLTLFRGLWWRCIPAIWNANEEINKHKQCRGGGGDGPLRLQRVGDEIPEIRLIVGVNIKYKLHFCSFNSRNA